VLLFATILYILFSGKVNILINPLYKKFLIISEFILAIFIFFAFLEFFKGHHSEKPGIGWILIIAICLLVLLSSYKAYQINSSRVKTVQLSSNSAKKSFTSTKSKDEDIPVTDHLIINDKDFIKTLTDIYDFPDKYDGKEITIKGFVVYSNYLGKDYFIIARMAMYCCAADAEVTGLACDTTSKDWDIDRNKWYSITGTISKKELTLAGGKSIYPVIQPTSINEIEPLDSPYVYPFF
ncbi:MAG: TIGR03943 family protein, partial [Spirochaetales bacterium]|nr:TIGR03943 family protein [Spirochaetales bacterium]